MPIFDATSLQGVPAPFWFVEFFKTLGFGLHLFPMGLWLVGIPVSLLLWIFGRGTSRLLAQRFFQQTPIIVALGINLAIVPLLFIQLAYAKPFYTSTILLGVHWLSIIPLVLVAYYACYLTSRAAKHDKKWGAAFWAFLSSVCFVSIGLIFSSVWTFFERPYEWEAVWRSSFLNVSNFKMGGEGSVLGTGTYWNNLSIFLRFSSIVGISFYSLATWFVFEAQYLYKDVSQRTGLGSKEQEKTDGNDGNSKTTSIQTSPERYVAFTTAISFFLVLVGLLATVPSIGKYALDSASSFQTDSNWNSILWNILLGGIATALILPFIFILVFKLGKISGRLLTWLMVFSEVALIGFFATFRQLLQNANLRPYYCVEDAFAASEIQWGPIAVFLVIFVIVLLLTLKIVACLSSSKGSKPKKEKNVKQLSVKKESGSEVGAPKGAEKRAASHRQSSLRKHD